MGLDDDKTFYVLPISPEAPEIGAEISFHRWITTTADASGQTNISGTISLPPEGVIVFNDSTPLGAGGISGSASWEITNYAVIQVGVFSNVASATNGVQVQFSPDNVNWDHTHQTTYSGGTGVGYVFNAEYRYMRVRYTNGATPQTTFRLQVILKKAPVKQSLYTIDQAVSGNMFAELGKNVIIGKTTGGGGGFVDVKVNPSGALTVENTPSTLNSNFVEALTISNVSATSISLTNAKWIRIEADSTNTVALRWKMVGAATASSGMRLAAGGFAEIYSAGTLSVIAEGVAVNQKLFITYGS